MLIYRDNREELKTLTTEERKELSTKETTRLNGVSGTINTYSPRKERPLRIYLDRRPCPAGDADVDWGCFRHLPPLLVTTATSAELNTCIFTRTMSSYNESLCLQSSLKFVYIWLILCKYLAGLYVCSVGRLWRMDVSWNQKVDVSWLNVLDADIPRFSYVNWTFSTFICKLLLYGVFSENQLESYLFVHNLILDITFQSSLFHVQ